MSESNVIAWPGSPGNNHHDRLDRAERELAALRAEVVAFYELVQTRRQAGWLKVPVEPLERLHALALGQKEGDAS